MARVLKTVTVLRRAKALIVKGWCQKAFKRRGPKYCAWGALGAVVFKQPDTIYFDLPCDFLRNFVPDRDLVSYNDAPERTKADILALYDKAIAAAKAAQ